MPKDKGTEGIGKREHHMKMSNGKNAGEGAFNPLGSFPPLALWAVTIAAGVVRNALNEPAG